MQMFWSAQWDIPCARESKSCGKSGGLERDESLVWNRRKKFVSTAERREGRQIRFLSFIIQDCMYKVTSLPNISITVSSQPHLQLISPGLENSSGQHGANIAQEPQGKDGLSLQALLKQPKLRNAKETLCFKGHACSRMVPGGGSVTPGAVFPSPFQEMLWMRLEHSGPPRARCGRDWPRGRCGQHSGFQALMCVCSGGEGGGQDTPGVKNVLWEFQSRLPRENRTSPARRNENG